MFCDRRAVFMRVSFLVAAAGGRVTECDFILDRLFIFK